MAGESAEFERGHVAGVTATELAEHSKHLDKINGSMSEAAKALGLLAKEMAEMRADERFAREAELEGRERVAARFRAVTGVIFLVLLALALVILASGSVNW